MKILLVSNYLHNHQQSMLRFAELVRQLLTEAGHEVRLLHPPSVLGNLKPGETGLGKWFGYVDRFVLFRPRLRREAAWADLVHICDHANAVYAPMLGRKPHVVTCHDLLAIQSALGEVQNNRTGFSGRIFQRWILSGLRRAQQVVCVSERTRDELIRLGGLAPESIRVVHNALNHRYCPMPADEAGARVRALEPAGPWPFLLHVGGNQWYKNRAGVVRIFEHLARASAFGRHHLVMAGKHWPSELREQVQQSGLAERIHEWTEVSNEDLRALYSTAEALLFPSLQEGFGWPVVEAQSCGCPVVTSNRAPMTEVGGEAAVYIDPEDEAGAARKIVHELHGRDALVQVGLKNAERFSGPKMLAGYLDAYNAVLAVARSPELPAPEAHA
ncbi:MAG: glycosyltransferase family 4 protein [Panacagrimonas sp.]